MRCISGKSGWLSFEQAGIIIRKGCLLLLLRRQSFDNVGWLAVIGYQHLAVLFDPPLHRSEIGP